LEFQELKEKLLKLLEEDCPNHLSASLLAPLSAKQGEEATKENLIGVAKEAIILKIDLPKQAPVAHWAHQQHWLTSRSRGWKLLLPGRLVSHLAGDWRNISKATVISWMIVEGNPRLFAKLKGENLEELR
jgi:hypothetical protein